MGQLPHISADLAAVDAEFLSTPETFFVEEIPAYLPEGDGDHLFVLIRKTGMDTPFALKRLCQAVGADHREAGYAGLKDRHATTTQWVSLLGANESDVRSAEVDGLEVLDVRAHGHKLRTGHLRGNRFRIRLNTADAPDTQASRAEAILRRLYETGSPNYFGAQRFGRDNLERAVRMVVEGQRPPRNRFERKLLVSVFQSALFNGLLARRVREGTMGAAVEGDLLRKEDTGGLFTTDDLEDAQQRSARFEVSPTGPIFGHKMRAPLGVAASMEAAILAEAGVDEDTFKPFRKIAEGTRRVLRVRPETHSAKADATGVWLEFALPKGAYATVILRELLRSEESPPQATAPE